MKRQTHKTNHKLKAIKANKHTTNITKTKSINQNKTIKATAIQTQPKPQSPTIKIQSSKLKICITQPMQ